MQYYYQYIKKKICNVNRIGNSLFTTAIHVILTVFKAEDFYLKLYAKIKILCILITFHASHYIFKMAAVTGCYENFIY